MMTFSILIIGIFSIENIKLDVSEEILLKIKKKTLIYKIICILFRMLHIIKMWIVKELAM